MCTRSQSQRPRVWPRPLLSSPSARGGVSATMDNSSGPSATASGVRFSPQSDSGLCLSPARRSGQAGTGSAYSAPSTVAIPGCPSLCRKSRGAIIPSPTSASNLRSPLPSRQPTEPPGPPRTAANPGNEKCRTGLWQTPAGVFQNVRRQLLEPATTPYARDERTGRSPATPAIIR